MQRILQINLAGHLVPVEEDAYLALKNYIAALERQFPGSEGKEILEDIENRIAELFLIRLKGGAVSIDSNDVQKVIDTLGAPCDLGEAPNTEKSRTSTENRGGNYGPGGQSGNSNDRLLRDPYNKVIGGVCSGIARYFDIDPVLIRLIMVVLVFCFGSGVVAYCIAWAIIPEARSREELNYRNPMTIHDITTNVAAEMQDLKVKAEQMSRELKEFFSSKR